MRFYLDACIWGDYWENRSDNFRPLGEWAFRYLSRRYNIAFADALHAIFARDNEVIWLLEINTLSIS